MRKNTYNQMVNTDKVLVHRLPTFLLEEPNPSAEDKEPLEKTPKAQLNKSCETVNRCKRKCQ